MPPSREACAILATTYEAIAEIKARTKQIQQLVLDAVKLKNIIKFGIDITDTLGAELVSGIAAISSQVSKALLGPASAIASNVMENILSKILQILLAFPTAIFSLVAIPHEQAKNAVESEKRSLVKAQNNLKSILRIISKWANVVSGQDYYDQMVGALPYITRAIEAAADIIRKLENEDNSVFDESKYKLLQASLSQAIEITLPKSTLDDRLQISSRIEGLKDRNYSKKATLINKEYRERKKDLVDLYREEALSSGSGSNNIGSDGNPKISSSASVRLGNAIKEQYIDLKYQNNLKDLNSWRKNELSKAESEAEIEAIKESSIWTKAGTDVLGDFTNDVKMMNDQLYKLLRNTKDAYLKNKESQLYCNNIYDTRNIIKRIVTELISLIRSSSNAAGNTLATPVKAAKGFIEFAETEYLTATSKYVASDAGISSTELSGAVSLGHGSLITAEATLNASVTDSLIALINSDDVLQASDENFEAFINELFLIPDWDGKIGVWSVDMKNGSLSPYIQLIADTTEALAKAPAIAISNKNSDKERIRNLMRRINSSFSILFRHNRIVRDALNTYTSYMASEAGDLKSILASAGLLKKFALTMSITTLAADILSTTKGELGDEFPSYARCSTAYPDLFTDLELARGAAAEENDIPAEQESNRFIANAENKTDDTTTAKKIVDTKDLNRTSESGDELKNENLQQWRP